MRKPMILRCYFVCNFKTLLVIFWTQVICVHANFNTWCRTTYITWQVIEDWLCWCASMVQLQEKNFGGHC